MTRPCRIPRIRGIVLRPLLYAHLARIDGQHEVSSRCILALVTGAARPSEALFSFLGVVCAGRRVSQSRECKEQIPCTGQALSHVPALPIPVLLVPKD